MVGGKPLTLARLEHALEHDESVRAHLHPAVRRDVELHGQPVVGRRGRRRRGRGDDARRRGLRPAAGSAAASRAAAAGSRRARAPRSATARAPARASPTTAAACARSQTPRSRRSARRWRTAAAAPPGAGARETPVFARDFRRADFPRGVALVQLDFRDEVLDGRVRIEPDFERVRADERAAENAARQLGEIVRARALRARPRKSSWCRRCPAGIGRVLRARPSDARQIVPCSVWTATVPEVSTSSPAPWPPGTPRPRARAPARPGDVPPEGTRRSRRRRRRPPRRRPRFAPA